MKTPNLTEILAEQTETKPEVIKSDFAPKIEEKPPVTQTVEQPQQKDFVQPEPVKSAPVIDKAHFAQTPPPTITPKVQKPPLSASENANTANMIVGMYDALQTLTFPYAYQRSMFSKEERKGLKDLKVKMRHDTNLTLDENEQILMDKYATLEELNDNVTFTEDEAKMIVEPLAKVLGKYNIQLGPELLLIGALGMVALPRMLPFFSSLERL